MNKNFAQAHTRTRADHATEVREDYVEAIADLIEKNGVCRVVNLAARFGVSHVSVIQVVQRLKMDKLVEKEAYRPVTLTPKGLRLAQVCRERHDVVYRFLLHLGVSEGVATLDAEGLEHHLSAETLDRIRDFIKA
ncbi:MAG: manganese-binding transcriptional regulator MntR [Pontiella sp.]